MSTPADVIRAQHRLAGFLRPPGNTEVLSGLEPPISAVTCRQVIASQLYLTTVFKDAAARNPRAEALVADFAVREEVLRDLQPRLRYLVDINRYDADWDRRHQQLEIVSAVSSWLRNSTAFSFTAEQLLDLSNATHAVLHNLGRELRREVGRDNTNIGRAHPLHRHRVTRVDRRTRLGSAIVDLANLPAPTTPISEHLVPLQRAALRGTLDLTPTEPTTPRPITVSRWEGPKR